MVDWIDSREDAVAVAVAAAGWFGFGARKIVRKRTANCLSAETTVQFECECMCINTKCASHTLIFNNGGCVFGYWIYFNILFSFSGLFFFFTQRIWTFNTRILIWVSSIFFFFYLFFCSPFGLWMCTSNNKHRATINSHSRQISISFVLFHFRGEMMHGRWMCFSVIDGKKMSK